MLMELSLIVATFLGPVFAVQAQKFIERRRDGRARRLEVFKTLMATRAAGLSPKHVEALNMIDLEFYDEKFVKVRDAWRTYFDHLCSKPAGDATIWASKIPDLLATLLAEMATALDYRFDQVTLKKGAYMPVAHTAVDEELGKVRRGLLNLLEGSAPLKIEPVVPSDAEPSPGRLPPRE